MAETGKMNSQPSTSYSTPIQYMGLSATISTLETTSGLTGTGSDVGRPQKRFYTGPPVTNGRLTAYFLRKSTSDSHFWPNREWKCGGNRTHELAAIDFLFDFNTMYRSIGHSFNARDYSRSRRNRKYRNLTTADVNNASRPVYEARESTFGR